jgi:chorismate mutase/prephenate dehydratase
MLDSGAMADDRSEFARIRDAVEDADRQLVAALEARARATRAFVELRDRAPESYDSLPPAAAVVQRALESSEQFPRDALEVVMREVVGACARMVAPVEVVALGPEGGFAHVAARRQFGSTARVEVRETVAEVFEVVQRRRGTFGLVPFETSSDGAVSATLDALVQSDCRISGELTLPNTYDLVSVTGNAADVEKIYGTSLALAACEGTLRRDFRRATLLDVRSGLVAAQLASEDHGAAAIVAGFDEASSPQPLRRVRDRIEDRAGIETRFLVVGHERPIRTGQDRTMLALAVGEGPGSLYRALQPFADRNIDLTRIESRPARGTSWRHVFIVELEGHMTDRSVLTAIEDVRAASRHLEVLGSYPRPRASLE